MPALFFLYMPSTCRGRARGRDGPRIMERKNLYALFFPSHESRLHTMFTFMPAYSCRPLREAGKCAESLVAHSKTLWISRDWLSSSTFARDLGPIQTDTPKRSAHSLRACLQLYLQSSVDVSDHGLFRCLLF